MTKSQAIELLREWAVALEHARKAFETERAKDGNEPGSVFRPGCMAWAFLSGWMHLDEESKSLLARTNAALPRSSS